MRIDRLNRPDAMPITRITNALTIDVEDYFQVSAFAPYIARSEWETRECRVERNIERILAMLDQHQVHATFFTLGWIAERYPRMVRLIGEQGHEVASHGYGHQRATQQTKEEFFRDVNSAKIMLENLTGLAVKGYRAPSFSIGAGNLWAFDCLLEAGYSYSSSIYPIHHDHYGMPNSPRFAHEVRSGLTEVPLTTVRLFNRNLPCGGGGYFRLLPYAFFKSMLERVNSRDRQPGIFYFHPWELDVAQPRVSGLSSKTRFRHYLNLGRMEGRLNQLLADFNWGRMDDVFFAKPSLSHDDV